MNLKQRHITVYVILLLAISVAMMYFIGCAGTQPRQLTAEQQKAIDDSLRQVHEHKINLNLSLGYERYKQQSWGKAKKFFLKASEVDTSGIKAKYLYQWLGTCFAMLNQPDSAEWAYNRGLDFAPNHAYFYTALIHLYKIQGRFDEGLKLAQTLIELQPDSASSYKIQGELYRLDQNIEDAITAYNRALELNPKDQETQQILSDLYKQRGDITELIGTLENVVEQMPDNVNKRIELAKAYTQVGEYAKAVDQLKFVLSKEPENISALELIGDAYQNLKQYSNAISTYKQILGIQPNDKKNLCNLAMSYSSAGYYTTALTQIQRALSIDPKYGLAYLTKGMVYENAADKCVEKRDGKISFDDKLVYKMAYDEYQKAKKDIQWKFDANKRIEYVSLSIPKKEDYFMHKNQTKPRGDCYNWIQ